MKQIVLLGCAVLTALMLAGTGAAGDQIDTSNILVMGYYDTGTEIDLSQAIQEFDYVTESTGQYVEGKLQMWCDHPDGRKVGYIQDYERRDDTYTDILFASNVSVRVKSDGWIVAWLTNDQNIGDIVLWNDANSGSNPSDTTIGKAIWRITDRVGIDYDKNGVNYYSYKYPAADRLLIGGRMVTGDQGETYRFLIPSAPTLYAANHTWTAYLYDPSATSSSGYYASGSIKMDGEYVFGKSTTPGYGSGLYEYARYYRDITDMARDARHTIYITSHDYSSCKSVLKSAVAILYQSG
ncbi:MAG: hypothetical protein K8S56_06540 [Candidatus Cloacimonetes bacterium]|nr:hypothetical protein [Candidatus Cloacimonadota bacterium]